MHICICNTYKHTYICCVQLMAYVQWDVTASSGNWWYPWTMVCDFSSVLNPLSFSLAFTLAVLLMAEHLVLLAPSFSKEDWMTPKHHPVSLFGFQGRLCVPSVCCAMCSCSSLHQPARWLTDAAALYLRCLWNAFFSPCIPSHCPWWCWVTHFHSLW